MYGFDTAGTLAEETNDPRRAAPPAILRALAAAALIGALLILFALMSVKDIHDKNIGLLGLPYIIKQALGNTLGNLFLIASAIAITVCCLAVCTACIRMLFSMARDGRLPFGTPPGPRFGAGPRADHSGDLRRRVLAAPARRQHRQPVGVRHAHLGGDHHVLPALPGGHRINVRQAAEGRVAAAGARAVLQHGPLGCCRSTASPSSTGRSWRSRSLGRERPCTGRSGTSASAPTSSSAFRSSIGCLYYFLVQVRKPPEVLAEHRSQTPALPDEGPMGEVAP